jgi:hypothetical protein
MNFHSFLFFLLFVSILVHFSLIQAFIFKMALYGKEAEDELIARGCKSVTVHEGGKVFFHDEETTMSVVVNGKKIIVPDGVSIFDFAMQQHVKETPGKTKRTPSPAIPKVQEVKKEAEPLYERDHEKEEEIKRHMQGEGGTLVIEKGTETEINWGCSTIICTPSGIQKTSGSSVKVVRRVE